MKQAFVSSFERFEICVFLCLYYTGVAVYEKITSIRSSYEPVPFEYYRYIARTRNVNQNFLLVLHEDAEKKSYYVSFKVPYYYNNSVFCS